MKRIMVLLFLLALPAVSFAQPSISLNSEKFDFGEVQGDVIEHTFDFANSGDQELVIKSLAPSWGCAAVMASSDHLKPGEKGKITAKIDIKGKSGALSKSIRVFSNDPQKPVVTLSLTATIKKQ